MGFGQPLSRFSINPGQPEAIEPPAGKEIRLKW